MIVIIIPVIINQSITATQPSLFFSFRRRHSLCMYRINRQTDDVIQFVGIDIHVYIYIYILQYSTFILNPRDKERTVPFKVTRYYLCRVSATNRERKTDRERAG